MLQSRGRKKKSFRLWSTNDVFGDFCIEQSTLIGYVNVALFEYPREKIDGDCCKILSLTNRYHVAVRLFSNLSQVTSKCGKNKKMAHKMIAECVTDFLPHFDVDL